MSGSIVRVEGLTKRFDDVTAVDGISFEIPRPAIVALLGGNGAGKTTTLSMLLGLLLPTAGSVHVLDTDMLTDRFQVLPRVNFSSPYVDLPKRLTVKENLVVYGRLYGLADVRGKIAQLVDDLAMSEFLERPFGQLSSGQRTRVSIAKSLLNEPELLFLDEPTASLDPDTADWVRAYLERYHRSHNATILLASHNMLEVERMCSDVLIMKAGRIVDRGAPDALVRRYGRDTLEDVFLDIARSRNGAAANAGLPGAAR